MTRIDAHDDEEPTLQGFWGLQLLPGKAYTQVVEAGFRVTMAALTDKIANEKSRTCVQVEVDNTTFVLCSLLPGRCEQQMLDTVFSEGETLRLSVTGNNAVDLTGYYLPPPDAMDYDMDSDEYDSDIEAEMDDSEEDEMDFGESDEDESDGDEAERAPPGKITEIRSIPIKGGDDKQAPSDGPGKRKAPESNAQPQKKLAAEVKTPQQAKQAQPQQKQDAKTPQQKQQQQPQQPKQDAKTPQQKQQQQPKQDAKTPQQQQPKQDAKTPQQAASPAAKQGQQPAKTPEGKQQQQKVQNKAPAGQPGKKGKGK